MMRGKTGKQPRRVGPAKLKFTERVLKYDLLPEDKPFITMDTNRLSPPAFGVRVMPSRAMTFVLYRRFPGSPNATPRALGKLGEISLDAARDKAREWIAMIEKGIDPSGERKRVAQEAIEAERIRKANTLASVLEAYLRHCANLRSAHQRGRELRRVMADWMQRPITSISPRDIRELIESYVADGRTGQARYLLAIIKTFFAWAADDTNDYGLTESPAAKLKAAKLIPVEEDDEGERVLDDAEIGAYWRAAGTLGYPLCEFYRMLILTGLRLSEAAGASWSEFSGARWIVPKERMKGKPGKRRPHLIPITPKIGALLKELPRHAGGEFLFSNNNGAKPISSFSAMKKALDAAMRTDLEVHGYVFKSWTVHDIRRSVRTRLSGIPGISSDIAERVMAHAKPPLGQIYDAHDYESEKAEALTKWHAVLEGIVEGRSNVTPFRREA